jgi:SH3-like domain-containing protein
VYCILNPVLPKGWPGIEYESEEQRMAAKDHTGQYTRIPAFRSLTTILVLLFAVSCTGSETAGVVPTLMELPSITPSDTPSITPTPSLTYTPSPSATITDTPTPTHTHTPSATPTETLTPTPIGDATVTGENGANLRRGPSTSYSPALALLPKGTALLLAGRSSDSAWFEVRTLDGLAGWVYSDLITVRRDLNSVQVTWVEPTPVPVVVGVPGDGSQPVVVSGISGRVRQIYLQGQALGNNAYAFSKVGDSITANQNFFEGFDSGNYDLGAAYGYLQDTIDFFSGSFWRKSYAASSAFNAAAVLAPMWADPTICLPNETPMDCEYREQRPAISIIMLGSIDVQLYDASAFHSYMDIIVQSTISQGIIPVLTTFPNGPNYYPQNSEVYNGIIREIANREQIPLIELRYPAMGMPNNGVLPDEFHLSQRGDDYISFSGDQNQYALTLRDLLTLQMLHDIRIGAMY